MSIVIKAPDFPLSAKSAQVGHWYKELHQVIARNEILLEIHAHNQIIPVYAPQAGILERIMLKEGQAVNPGTVVAYLKMGLPNLLWDSEQDMLILDTYRAEGVTTSMEYELRQLIRLGEGKLGKGFGSGLALPQIRQQESNPGAGMGMGMGMGMEMAEGHNRQFKKHPKLNTSQFAGDFKDPRVNTVPSNAEAQQAPQNAPTLGLNAQPGPSAPTPRPSGG